jgi:cell division septal protein FtsQ
MEGLLILVAAAPFVALVVAGLIWMIDIMSWPSSFLSPPLQAHE